MYQQTNISLSTPDELFEYLWLKPSVTKLNVDVFVDDGGSYLRNQHPLLLWARNGYDKSLNEFIPFSISETPQKLNQNTKCNLSNSDIESVRNFIVLNQKVLQLLADNKISHQDFLAMAKK